ncbi:MAG TPA: Maf family protein [Terriglobales bacterium]|nr:Maf family protein [Terriglobales bacterium]
MPLILASSSPRRRELLQAASIPFISQPADVPEVHTPGELPTQFSERLAREKARAVWQKLPTNPSNFVLGADTIVIVDNHILGKPGSPDDAVRMLRLISGRTHEVTTSVCLIGANSGRTYEDVRSETSRVVVSPISEQEIRDYVGHGEPMDKAGAYAIQGVAGRWIPRIEGCYFNIVGLPIPLVYRMLKEHGAL